MIVVDTNVLAYFLIASPLSGQANAVHLEDPEWAAPALWRSELRNVLTKLMRRGGLSLSQALRHFAEAEVTLARRQYDSDTAAVLELAARTGCTAYDCEFAALARDLGVPLVTADRRLAAAFPDIAVTLGEFVTNPGKRR